MTRSPTAALLGPEYDDFLFASVEEDGNGVFVSVVSALARLGLDPWYEASLLARMAPSDARKRMTALIAALPGAAAPRSTAEAIADRLVRRLPLGKAPSVESRRVSLVSDSAPTSRTVIRLVLINVLVVAGMLAAQWTFASLRHTAPADTAQVPAPPGAQPGPPAPDAFHR